MLHVKSNFGFAFNRKAGLIKMFDVAGSQASKTYPVHARELHRIMQTYSRKGSEQVLSAGQGCFHQVGGAPEGLTCTNSKNQTTRGKGQLNTDPKYLSKKGIKEFCGVGTPGSGSGRFLVPGGD